MTEKMKADIVEIYEAAKDKKEQIRLMVSMGFGTRAQILHALHDEGLALEFKTSGRRKAEETKQEAEPEPKEEPKEKILPSPQDVKQLLIDSLEQLDGSIKELEEMIQAKEIEKRRLENLYEHIVEIISK